MAMIECPSCRRQVPADGRFCSSCGSDLGTQRSADAAVLDATATSVPESSSDVSLEDPSAVSAGRFAPGTMISSRYRIVGLLGRGGMGEVYRADDLKLGRPVALKFLPEHVERDPLRLSRFLNEVRTALRVSHPNVCRVHDINDIGGRHYISMEFVDGDDLAGLLRQIGRMPEDKAIQIARQLCAGLAAAHAEGILHRDLKPANIMIDGRGQVKITDFGLAGLAGEFEGEEVRAGTPFYMAPEQLAGKQVSTASDIYALGLVLYEVFTGKPAFEGTSADELRRRRESAPTSLSSYVQGVDPAVERVILRCLERDPSERPGSALAVAAALPGGDPLAAALAAGETPDPQLVAEAGAVGGLQPKIAVMLLTAVLVSLVALIGFAQRFELVSRADLPKSPAVLTEKAREILSDAGYDTPPQDSLSAFEVNRAYYEHLQALEPGKDRWDVVKSSQPAVIMFGYRQDPGPIAFESLGRIGDWINRSPPTMPGAVRLRLDPSGRLLWLDAVLPEREGTGDATAEPDWNGLLAAAGFDPARMTAAEPVWLPQTWVDHRRAWDGVYPDAPEVAIRVEAAAYDGRAVSFRIVEPWTRPKEAPPPPAGFWSRASQMVYSVWFLVVVFAASVLAWRNVRLGRGDRRTAVRLALLLAAIRFVWILDGHHVPTAAEIDLLESHLAWSMYRFGLVCVFYLAFEPYARKLWPHMLTSWVRLFDMRFRDPLVGRDLLIGVVFGTAFAMSNRMAAWTAEFLELPGYGLGTGVWSVESLRGFRGAIGALAGVEANAMMNMFIALMLMFVLRLLFRRTWIMVVVVSLLGLVLTNPGQGHPVPFLVFSVINFAGFWFVFLRIGLLPVVLGVTIVDAVSTLPLTFDLTAWWSTPTWLVLLLCIGIAGWGFSTALAGRPIFRDQILDET